MSTATTAAGLRAIGREAPIWSLAGWLPLCLLWATGHLDWAGLLLGAVVAFLAGGLLALWRIRELGPLLAWVERVRDGQSAPGAVPDSFLYGRLPPALLAVERETQALRQQIASSDELLRAIVDAVPDPMLVVSARGHVRLANPAAEQHFAQKLPGQPLGRFLRDPGILAAIDSAILGDVSSMVTFSPLLERMRRYTCRVQPVKIAGGEPAAVLCLRETSEQLAIERMRSDFIANASHELRTPLTALLGFVETLKGPAKDDPAAQAMFLDIMAAEAGRMTRLIDDLLSLSRLEAESSRPPTDEVELNELIVAAVNGLEPQLQKNGTAVEIVIEDGLPPVCGDYDQLQQLVTNLVDNASKYGRPGTPVRVELRRLDPAGPEAGPLAGRPAVQLAVVDQGEGIAPEHLPRLTERFYRADKGRSRRAGGTGLGLAICKHIVRRHGGHLSVASRLGEGSRFSVFLPLP
ncbi:MAG TPA: ATP-binding protein [Geminicoccus sp.]|uniref:sensor histidine kinase n=1 Tax=Geminicoccus sp. TaxID=2024832 RepID=UPI002BAFDFF9|nr:ATP-binding protein [Geminicoccus sp.]HWL69858.1 ATP-binding protein [Geminicoccus sp.]